MSALFRRKRIVEPSLPSQSSETEADCEDTDEMFFGSTKRKRTKRTTAASSSVNGTNSQKPSADTTSGDGVIVGSNSNSNSNSSGRKGKTGRVGSAASSSSSSSQVIDLADSPRSAALPSQSTSMPLTTAMPIVDLDEDIGGNGGSAGSSLLSSSFIDQIDDPRIKESLEVIRMSQKRLLSANNTVFIHDDSVIAPVLRANIPSAAERLRQASQSLSSSTPITSSIHTSHPSSNSPPSEDENVVQVRTRLNGRHDHVWRMGVDESFSKLMQRVNTLYGLPPGKLSLVLDGDRISPDQTPSEFDLEAGDEVVVEATIEAELYSRAVEMAMSASRR